MTKDEAEIVAKIMLTADNFCSTCYHALLEQFAEAFPEHAGVAKHIGCRANDIEHTYHEAHARWVDADEVGEEPRVWKL